MQALAKRIEALEAKQPPIRESAMFIHLVSLGGTGDPEWVRRYSCGSQIFDREEGETLEDFQRRVEVSAIRTSSTGFLAAMAFQSPG